jgi:predicted transglutaminase-like cysteine proteinase
MAINLFGRIRLFHRSLFDRKILSRRDPRTTAISRKPAAHLRRAFLLVPALALTLLVAAVASPADAKETVTGSETLTVASIDTVAVFGAEQMKVKKSKSFSNWQRMLKRFEKEEERLAKGRARMNEKGAMQQWNELIASLQGLDQATQVAEVNKYFNSLSYQSDKKLYDAEDYWATPFQFLSRAKGDCEDFATAKYFALRALGFSSDQLRLVAGFDKKRGGAHAVTLVVLDGRVLMLDIGKGGIQDMAAVTQFKPFYSVTESGGWLHTKRA